MSFMKVLSTVQQCGWEMRKHNEAAQSIHRQSICSNFTYERPQVKLSQVILFDN